ncbi:MAG: YceD family protein [Lachnospiraceae bacterium]
MKVDITNVLTAENRTVEISVETELESFISKLGEFPITKKAPFELHLENLENKKLLVFGETEIILRVPCGRCLQDVTVGIPLSLRKEYLIGITQVDTDDAEYITESSLDVDKIVYDEILVNWPMKVLCSDNCRGICGKCGANLNVRTCSCEQTELDPRMAAIQDIFNQFKEV